VIGFVRSHDRAGDALVLGHCSMVYPFWYYCPPAMRERMYLAGNPAAYVNDAATLYGMKVTFGIEVSGSGKIDRSVSGVWLVQTGWEDVPVPLAEEWQRWFDKQQKVYETDVFKGMRLAYFRIASRDGGGGQIWEHP
jgi:hypothetical protein